MHLNLNSNIKFCLSCLNLYFRKDNIRHKVTVFLVSVSNNKHQFTRLCTHVTRNKFLLNIAWHQKVTSLYKIRHIGYVELVFKITLLSQEVKYRNSIKIKI